MFDQLQVGSQSLHSALANATTANLMTKSIDIFLCPSDNSPETNEGLRSGKYNYAHDRNWAGTCHPSGATFWTATANYVASSGHGTFDDSYNDGALPGQIYIPITLIRDGTSNVILLGEREQEASAATWVGAPDAFGGGPKGLNYVAGSTFQKINSADPTAVAASGSGTIAAVYGFSSRHPGGAQFAMADGKVTFLSENIDFNHVYCAGGGNNCYPFDANGHQNRDRLTSTTMPGAQAGVFQRLGHREDGLSVSVP